MANSPYKFLDHYEYDPPRKDDRAIFFGRERETRILLADVLVSRLVVLFARTGTGKTSLINAGVRPRLEEQDYSTYYVRVSEDPVASARAELENHLGARLTGGTLAELMGEAQALRPRVPGVLFFDQFEEFFIYVKADSEQGRRFIADVADLCQDPKSDTHIVFSMREEFFHEMNEFREQIPTIFHNDSNLRLRWFDDDQAREAIIEPARLFGTGIDRDLEDQLIRDLRDPKENDRIEPAQLQIVCDTLWKETAARRLKDGNRITLEHYNTLGQKGSSDTIAVQVLYRRLEEMFQNLESQTQLRLLYALLPKLRTPWKTKYVRDILGVVKELTADDACLRDIIRDPMALHSLVEQLKSDDRPLREVINQLVGVRLLRTGLRDKLEVIELSHDYLVGALESLQDRVKAIILRRSLRTAMDRHAAEKKRLAEMAVPGADAAESLNDAERDSLFMSRSDFEALSEGAALLGALAEAEAQFLFDAALEHGLELRAWFERADASAVDVWKVLRDRVELSAGRTEQVRNALQLLGELRGGRAVQLLESALHHPELAPSALDVLGKVKSGEALDLLEKSLRDASLADKVIDVLRRMRTPESVGLLAAAVRRGGQARRCKPDTRCTAWRSCARTTLLPPPTKP